MKSMIYYPGFEMENEEWLKFALLYFEELRPIIPYMNTHEGMYLSKNAIRIMYDTDLINPYRPDYEESYCASVIACDLFDKYLKNPDRYSYAFAGRHNINIAEKWRNPSFQDCNLYDGKFSDEFYRYCLDNGIARPFNDGITISKDLAFVYMSLLADVISKTHGLEMFTDVKVYNDLLLNNDKQLGYSRNLKYDIKRVPIEFYVPEELKQIPLSSVIELRSNRNFKGCRRAYVNEIEKYLAAREADPACSFKEQLKIKDDLKRILNLAFGTTTSVYLTALSVSELTAGSISPAQALATIYSDLAAVKEIRMLPEYIRNISGKVQAKRYMGQIRKTYIRNGNIKRR